MTDQRELDRLLGAYFADGTDELADRVIDAALDQIDHTRQRRALRMPRRFPTMTMPIRLAAAAVIAALAVGGAFYLLDPGQPKVGGPSPAPTSQTPATSGPAVTGSGSAHYEITGPDAASGDAKFASSSTSDASSNEYRQSAVFQEGSVFIRIEFPAPGAVCSFCGKVDVSTATASLHDAGPTCTWDIASLAADGATGTVECTNLVNAANPTTPNVATITFAYNDPSE